MSATVNIRKGREPVCVAAMAAFCSCPTDRIEARRFPVAHLSALINVQFMENPTDAAI
jgi:hypothetical protein